MGVFVGHDHDNDFIGIDKGIALGYGRVTGADAYGEMCIRDRGCQGWRNIGSSYCRPRDWWTYGGGWRFGRRQNRM